MEVSKRQTKLKKWIRDSLPASERRTSGQLKSRPAKSSDTSQPGNVKHGFWRFKLQQSVYVRGWGSQSFTVVGGALDGPLGFPQYRLKDSRGVEQLKLQIAVSSKPIET